MSLWGEMRNATSGAHSLQSVLDRYALNVRIIRTMNGLGPDGPEITTVSDVIDQRARRSGWKPEGTRNASGRCRLLATMDGRWVAVNLARQRDVELVGLVLDLVLPTGEFLTGEFDPHRGPSDHVWDTIAVGISRWKAADLMNATADLGLAMSVVGEVRWPGSLDQLPVRFHRVEKRLTTNQGESPKLRLVRNLSTDPWRVVDLSSLWAGPLCSRLLMAAGFEVTTIQSSSRPDVSLDRHPDFYADLHRDKKSVVLDFTRDCDRQRLVQMLATCDVVIQGSRRRALDQMGIEINEILSTTQPAVWVSITGYGYFGPGEMRVGFGDDCAAAGGLLDWVPFGESVRPAFVGDAVADPVTGLIAATAILDCVRQEMESKKTSHQELHLQMSHHLQISLAESANWVSRGGGVPMDRRD